MSAHSHQHAIGAADRWILRSLAGLSVVAAGWAHTNGQLTGQGVVVAGAEALACLYLARR